MLHENPPAQYPLNHPIPLPKAPMKDDDPFVDRQGILAGSVRLTIGRVGQEIDVSGAIDSSRVYIPGVTVVIAPDAGIASDIAATRIVEVLRESGSRGLGTATGGTMGPIWQRVHAQIASDAALDLQSLFTIGLDEYVGLSPSSPESYHQEMRSRLQPLQRFGFRSEQIYLPETWDDKTGRPKSPQQLREECFRYEALVHSLPLRLQLLGLGHDGHIGFSMPWSDLHQRTHISDLSPKTRAANARFFSDDLDAVPKQAVTMGMGTLSAMAHRGTELLLIATGAQKADAVRDALFGMISPGCPASYLRLLPNVTFVLDQKAAGDLLGGVLEAPNPLISQPLRDMTS